MPYEPSLDRLESLIAATLQKREIQSGASLADLKEEFLASRLRDQASKIWDAAASDIEDHDQLERIYTDRVRELREREKQMRRSLSGVFARSSRRTLVTLFVALLMPFIQ